MWMTDVSGKGRLHCWTIIRRAMPEAGKKLKEKEEKGKGIEKEKKSTDDQKGKDVRKRDLENLSKDEEENQTQKKRTSSTNVMEYLQTKVNIENKNERRVKDKEQGA